MNVVVMSLDLRRELVSLCRATGEREACGALIGTRSNDGVIIVRVAAVPNLSLAPDAFECEAGAIVVLDREASAKGLEIVGFWHSHANGPGEPSTRDVAGAWSGTLTAIVCPKRIPAVRFWRFESDAAIEVRVAPSTSCATALRDHNLRPRTRP